MKKRPAIYSKTFKTTASTIKSRILLPAVTCSINSVFSIPARRKSAVRPNPYSGRYGPIRNPGFIHRLLLLAGENLRYNTSSPYPIREPMQNRKASIRKAVISFLTPYFFRFLFITRFMALCRFSMKISEAPSWYSPSSDHGVSSEA